MYMLSLMGIISAGPGLTAAPGTLIFGWILDMYGRKASLMISTLCNLVGWSMIYGSQSFMTIFIGRLITGVPAAFVAYAAQVYIVECLAANDKRLSDMLVTWPITAFSVGNLFTFILGALMTHLQFALFSATLSLILFALMYMFVTESPSWLHQKGHLKDAELASEKLCINQQPILAKNAVGQETLAATALAPAPAPPLAPAPASARGTFHHTNSDFWTIFQRFGHRRVYKPTLIMMVVCTLALMTGGMIFTSYMVNIIEASQPGVTELATTLNATSSRPAQDLPTDTKSYRYSLISGLLMVLATGMLSVLLPRVGARRLTIWSAAIMCVGMLLIGYTNGGANPSELMALRVLSVWLVTFVFSLGISVPFSILSAMFPTDARGFASLAFLMQTLAGFAVSQSYPYLYLASKSGVFYGYAAMCVLYGSFVYAFMPETVGRDYEQISANF